MEEEAREILRARVAKTGGVDLDTPARDAMRSPPGFDQ